MQQPMQDLGRAFGFLSEDSVHEQSVALQEDHAHDHAERVHVKLQGAFPGNATSVQTQPRTSHSHHGEAQQLGEGHIIRQCSRNGRSTLLHSETPASWVLL